MARTIPDKEPTTFVAGETVKWYRNFSDFPVAEGWTLTYSFTGPAKMDLDSSAITASVANGRWEIVVPTTTTTTLIPGPYNWEAFVELSGERYVAAAGVVVVMVNVSSVTAMQNRAEVELAIVDAAIAGRLTADTESFQINGRAVSKTPLADLLKIRGFLREEVRRQRSGNAFETVRVSFARAN